MLAVAGGTSAAKANGSARRLTCPCWLTTSNLYRAPGPTPGRKISQTPELPSTRIGCRRPSQPLKSPTTRTARAPGAHTANEVPGVP